MRRRWELRLALEAKRPLVPTMVDGARLPDRLPPDIAALRNASWIDLDQANWSLRYQELLGDLFFKVIRKQGDVVMVTDDTAEAEVHLRKLATMLKGGELGDEGREILRAATRGFAAIPLGDAATQWPDVIVLRDPNRVSGVLDAREAGVRRNTGHVLIITGGAALLAFAAGRATAGSGAADGVGLAPDTLAPDPAAAGLMPTAPAPSPALPAPPGAPPAGPSLPPPPAPTPPLPAPTPQPVGNAAAAPADSAVHATASAGRRAGGGLRSVLESWQGLSTVAQGAVLAAVVATAVVAGAVIRPGSPIPLAGAWDVTDFEWTPVRGDATSTVSLDGGRMVFRPAAGCDQEPCDLVIEEGPDLLVNVTMTPERGGSRFVGDAANILHTCDGQPVPEDLTDTTLTATRGSGDTLEFVITSSVTEQFRGCEPWTQEYTATATPE